MRSRMALVSLFLFLSGLLAFLPVVEATAAGSGQAAAAPEVAAQNKAQPKSKQQKQRLAKKKKQRQQRTKKRQRQKAKQRRNQQRSGNARPAAAFGQPMPRRLPGGQLPGARGRLAAASAPGERYIVTFKSDRVNSRAAAMNLGQQPGVIPTHAYQNVVTGFAAYLTPAGRQALARDPRVESITRSRRRQTTAQTLPRGINRVDADLNSVAAINGGGPGVDVDIAIIDTGIDFSHPDLNVHAWADCTDSPADPGWDQNGHGTHVSGTAAAIDNDIGVVGVAPGARIWSMRVEDDFGIIEDAYIIACMDQVALHANTPVAGETIDVANMSLGGFFPNDRCDGSDAFNDSVCGMVNAGVTVVVAAGNESTNAAGFNPANIDAVITVSALADNDGQPGGLGGTFNAVCQAPQRDDGLATFSNFGADVDIAAPGIDVLSTFPTYINEDKCAPSAGVGYEIYPGTSMASPHVAGAAGLLLSVNSNLTPAQVKAALLASRENVAMPGDPDCINEGILELGPGGGGGGPSVCDVAGPALSVNGPNAVRDGRRFTIRANAADPSGVARVELYLCKPNCRKVAQDATAPYTFRRRHNQPGRVRYIVRAFDTLGNFTDRLKTITIRP